MEGSTEKGLNETGSGHTEDRLQRQGLENTVVRLLVPYHAGTIDCCPHVTGIIEMKELCWNVMDIHSEWQAKDCQKWRNTMTISRKIIQRHANEDWQGRIDAMSKRINSRSVNEFA